MDELQDTDPNQYGILRSLGAGELVADGPRFFLVGDPKQSIYRFRRADLGAYAEFAQDVERTGARLSLSSNFRSREALLRPVNALFEKVMVEEEGRQPPYEAIDAAPHLRSPADAGPRLRFLMLAQNGKIGQAREAEAAVLAREIVAMHDEGCAYGSAMVLLPTLAALPQIQAAFHRAAIPSW